VVGLYAAVPALVLYAVLGSSRHLVVSPMSATAALAVVTGAVALTAGLLRLGRPGRDVAPLPRLGGTRSWADAGRLRGGPGRGEDLRREGGVRHRQQP
jgi:hypothetical protein